jgi:hypothetical protein
MLKQVLSRQRDPGMFRPGRIRFAESGLSIGGGIAQGIL